MRKSTPRNASTSTDPSGLKYVFVMPRKSATAAGLCPLGDPLSVM
jgi:hypothetical protein